MFTGIVEEMGEVVAIDRLADSVRLTVRGETVTSDARHGDSIAVNGCCLTVVDVADGAFTADVMQESLDRTSLGRLDAGEPGQPRARRHGAHPPRRPPRPGPCRRRRHRDQTRPERALGGRHGVAAERSRPLCRDEGVDRRRRRLSHGERAQRRRPADLRA